MACGGDFHRKNFKLKKKFIFFIIFNLLMFFILCYYCSINLTRQSEHSGLCPDTSIVVLYFEAEIGRFKRSFTN